MRTGKLTVFSTLLLKSLVCLHTQQETHAQAQEAALAQETHAPPQKEAHALAQEAYELAQESHELAHFK